MSEWFCGNGSCIGSEASQELAREEGREEVHQAWAADGEKLNAETREEAGAENARLRAQLEKAAGYLCDLARARGEGKDAFMARAYSAEQKLAQARGLLETAREMLTADGYFPSIVLEEWLAKVSFLATSPAAPPPVLPERMVQHLKHMTQDGSRLHVLHWDSQGSHCSEPRCEVNAAHSGKP